MSRYTAAYSGFITRLEEIEIILKMASRIERAPPLPKNAVRVNALCRGGVVLLSSHIEGYVEELGEIILERVVLRNMLKSSFGIGFRYNLSRDLIKDLQQATQPEAIEGRIDAFLKRDLHIWDTNEPSYSALLPSSAIMAFSTPTHNKLKKFFRRFSYESFEGDLASRLTANYDPCRNMINQVVDQRNKIAHGDAVITGTPSDLADMIRLVKLYCRETDCVVANWFKDQGCPIR